MATCLILAYHYYHFYTQVPREASFLIKYKSYRKKLLTRYDFIGIQRRETKNSHHPESTDEYEFFVENVEYYDEMHELDTVVPMNVYIPKMKDIEGVMLFFHGSGFCTSHPNGYHSHILEKFVLKGFIVLAMDYRKGPEFKQSCGLRDSEEGLRWIHENLAFSDEEVTIFPQDLNSEYTGKKHQEETKNLKTKKNPVLIVIGDSAGGGISIHLAKFLREISYKFSDEDFYFRPERTLIVPIYPWICFQGQEYCPVKWDIELSVKAMVCDGNRLNDFTRLSIDDPNEPYFKVYNFFDEEVLADPTLPLHYVFTAEYDVLAKEGNYFSEQLLQNNPSRIKHLEIEGEIHGFGMNGSEVWGTVIQEIYDTSQNLPK